MGNPQGGYPAGRLPQQPYQGRPAYQQGQAYPQAQGNPQGQPRESGEWHNNGGRWSQGPGPQGQGYRGQDGRGQGYQGQAYQGNRGPGYGRPGPNPWNHGWRQDNRYDWRGWRAENGDAFRAGRYYPPYRGYYYNRLSIGYYLQPMFYANDYWIADTDYYHLPPAYGPYRWVRYYNDVLLVNIYTGEVADEIYDFFW